jgi:hypothetical protein
MKRHPLRWEGLVFGALFLGVVITWLVWTLGLLDVHQLAYVAAATLIIAGLLGIAASVRRPTPAATVPPAAPAAAPEEVPDASEEVDAQS